jgi:hypothetical protein
MYMFDSVLTARDGVPTFISTELHGLPAAGSSSLWRATSRQAWQTDYNQYLARWPDGILRLDELWPMPADFDDKAIRARRARVDRWLINLDEYGIMLYTVTSCTHGT